MNAQDALTVSAKTADLAEIKAMLESDAYAGLVEEIDRLRAESDAKLRDLTLPNAIRDGAAGAVNALDQVKKFLPSRVSSLSATVAASRHARLGQSCV